MEADMAKQKKRVNPSSEKTPKKKKAKTNAKSAERKIKDPKAKVTKVDRGKTKAKKSKDKAQPMLNLGGLTGNPSDYNMFEAANHNVGKTNLSAVNETRKADQLKALLASVPENDLRSAHVDIKHIRNATVQLFRRNIRPAPGGEWRMRGMRLPLKNHQVLVSHRAQFSPCSECGRLMGGVTGGGLDERKRNGSRNAEWWTFGG